MISRKVFNMVLALCGLSLFASCSPKSSEQSGQTFQSAQTSNIVGGVDSTLDYQKANGIVGVLMIFKDQLGGTMGAGCTASLIAKNVVVTAAHCLLTPKPGLSLVGAVVYFGTDQSEVMKQVSLGDKSNLRQIDGVLRNSNYKPGMNGTNNDIGLIRFAGELPAGFQLASRATVANTSALKAGSTLTLAGFGLSQYKMDPTSGKLAGTGSGVLRQIDNMVVTSVSADGDEITLDQSQDRGACHGDSGGPAYAVDPVTQKNILIGITSRTTDPRGLCAQNSIYTAVSGYAAWIDAGLVQLAAQ